MSWSTKLILVFVCFGVFMSYMIYRCMNVPVNLVSKAYYKDEIAYQEVIDAKKNTLTLEHEVVVTAAAGELVIKFPEQQRDRQLSGTVLLYNPQQMSNDRSFEIPETLSGQQTISLASISPGRYIAKLQWRVEGKSYYAEKEILIP
jgi:hypothetical protein